MTPRRNIGRDRGLLKAAAVWLIVALVAAWLFFVTGCNTGPAAITAQKPGVATGAGATFTGPTNSAQPSTQKAKRTVAYQPRRAPKPAPAAAPEIPVVNIEAGTIEPPPMPAIELPQVTLLQEETETTFGAHQDVSAILKAALAGFGTVRWIGLLGVVLGVGGLLHSAGNNESGYPMVWILTTAVGAVLLITNNGWLCLAACVPLLLYGAQKLGLLRIPPLP